MDQEDSVRAPRTRAYQQMRHEQTTAEAKAVITRDLEAAREKTRRLRALREAAEEDVVVTKPRARSRKA